MAMGAVSFDVSFSAPPVRNDLKLGSPLKGLNLSLARFGEPGLSAGDAASFLNWDAL